MCADRSLWVDDAYALRCRGCNKSFTWLRRKHHCRQCGQVFCANCLYSTPTSFEQWSNRMGLSATSSDDPSHAERLIAEAVKPTKVCHRCAQALAASAAAETTASTQTRSGDSVPRQTPPSRGEPRETKVFTSPLSRASSPPTATMSSASLHPHPSSSSAPQPVSPGVVSSAAPATTTTRDASMEAPEDSARESRAEVTPNPNSVAAAEFRGVSTRQLCVRTTEADTPSPVETPEEQAVRMSLTDPVKRRPNYLSEWLASVVVKKDEQQQQQHQQERDEEAGEQRVPIPPVSVDLLSWVGTQTTVAGEPQACTNLFPSAKSRAAGGARAATRDASLRMWNQQCHDVLAHRIARAVATLRPTARFRDTSNNSHCSGPVATRLAELVTSVAVLALRHVVVPLGSRVMRHVELLLTGDGCAEASEVLPGFGFFASLASPATRSTTPVVAAVEKARLLLLSGDVTFSSESCVSVLEYMNSYRGHLDTNLKKIARWSPDVIVVERGMHHYLQAALAKQYPAVVLLLHVGRHHLERLAWCTGGHIVADLSFVSLSELSSLESTPVGTCDRFDVRVVGRRVLCRATGLIAPCYAAVLIRGVEETEVNLDSWRRLWVTAVTTAYHVCAQVQLLHSVGLDPTVDTTVVAAPGSGKRHDSSGDQLEDATDTHAWTPNLCVVYPSRLRQRLVHAAAASTQDLRNQLVVKAIEVGALEDTAATLLMENTDQHVSGFPERRVLRFYQPDQDGGDVSLLQFLVSRVDSKYGTLVFVHRDSVISVTTATEERTAGLLRVDCSATAEALEPFQRVKAYSMTQVHPLEAVADESGSVALTEGAAHGVEAMSAPYCYFRCAQCAAVSAGRRSEDGAAQPAQRATPCSPHALNLSLGAFLEFLLYRDPSKLVCRRCQHAPDDSLAAAASEVCFLLFPGMPSVVTVSFRVTPLLVRALHLPGPTSLTPPQAGAPTNEPYDVQEMTELTHDLALLVDSAHSLVARCSGQSSAPSPELALLLEQATTLQDELTESAGMSASETTSWRWGPFQSLLRVYGRLAASLVPPLAPGSGTLSNTNATAVAAPTTTTTTAVLAPPPAAAAAAAFVELAPTQQWLYSPFVGRAVRWNEPTSLIGLALAQHQAMAAMGQSEATTTFANRAEALASLVVVRPDGSPFQTPKRVFLDDLRTASGVPLKPSPEAAHVVSVDIYLARPFEALRYLATNGYPAAVTDSLARCSRYQPAGGKSNSDFYRTVDDRLLLKRIRPIELRHFVASAATHYLRHMQTFYTAVQEDSAPPQRNASPLCTLGKVLGLFTMSRRSPSAPDSGTVPEQEHFMLVENLTAQQRAGTAYDLKGSQRNRVAAAGAAVGLDENLVAQLRKGQYLFISESDKTRLLTTLSSDTQMLMSSSIMDYSLMVAATSGISPRAGGDGQDEADPTLPVWTVGLIDYMQPYTGVKALESKMKSGFDTVLGYPSRAPTIIDPARYQQRFLLWMNRYFCGVPDRLSRQDARDDLSDASVHVDTHAYRSD